jgi:hypothetical protein
VDLLGYGRGYSATVTVKAKGRAAACDGRFLVAHVSTGTACS